MKMTLPLVVIGAAKNDGALQLIKDITNRGDELVPSCIDNNVKKYFWKIDTKYYHAEVDLCVFSYHDKEYFKTELWEAVEAIIIYVETNKGETFEELSKWEAVLENCESETRMLVCDKCHKDSFPRDKVLEWCLRYHCEFIELLAVPEIDDSSPIVERYGVDRIVESLEAHPWGDMTMKNGNTQVKNNSSGDHEDIESMAEFCDLFAQLRSMKDGVQSLPAQERKACAEQVVTAFWRAIGGDESELDDILDE